MKFNIEREKLSSGLRTVSRATAGGKSLLPILANVLIEADKDGVKITATDLGIAITTTMESATARKGSTTIPAKPLRDLVAKLPKGDVLIEELDGKVSLRQGTNFWVLPTMPAEDFPALPATAEPMFIIPAATLAEASHLVGFAAGSDASILSGVNIRAEGGKIAFGATDGYRLAARDFGLPSEARMAFDFTIPAKHLADLVAVLPGSDALVTLYSDGDQVTFLTDAVRGSARRLAGKFPAYEKVIPKAFDVTATVGRVPLKESLERVYLFGYGDGHSVTMALAGDCLKILGQDPNSGEAQEIVPATITGTPFTIGFQAKLMIEALALMPNEDVVIHLNSPVQPIVLRAPDADYYTSLIMPVRP